MTASVREAFLAAQAQRDEQMLLEHVAAPSQPLKDAVLEWSQDDSAHVDPPLQVAPQPPEEKVDPFINQGTGRGFKGRTQPRNDKGNHFVTTTNVTRETFNFIRDNPGKTRKEVMDVMVGRGFNAGSVSSLIGQFVMQHKVFTKDGGYYPAQAEFTPLKSGKMREELIQQKREAKKKPTKGTMTREARMARTQEILDRQHKEAPKAAPSKQIVDIVKEHGVIGKGPAPTDLRTMDADAIVEALGLKQARALYVKLKEVFSA